MKEDHHLLSCLYDGMIEAVEAIKRAGVTVAIASNKPHADTVKVVETLYPKDLFSIVLGRMDKFAIKPAPDALRAMVGQLGGGRAAFVGDTTFDTGAARAAGLPAREVAGLIYVEGSQPGFYFHQWATVWLGEWVDVDPTFNQLPVDVTHIKLSEGDWFRQAKILPLIGRMKIKVLTDLPEKKPAEESAPEAGQ